MLLNLHKKKWTDGLILRPFDTHSKTNEQIVQVCYNTLFISLYFLKLLLQTYCFLLKLPFDDIWCLKCKWWVLYDQEMLDLTIKYNKAVQEEDELPPEKLFLASVGRQDAKKHLEEHVSNLMASNIVQIFGTMLDTVVFWAVNLACYDACSQWNLESFTKLHCPSKEMQTPLVLGISSF